MWVICHILVTVKSTLFLVASLEGHVHFVDDFNSRGKVMEPGMTPGLCNMSYHGKHAIESLLDVVSVCRMIYD